MDDLVKRLNEAASPSQNGGGGGSWERHKALLVEAAATIARQQVMLDRALEDGGTKMVEIGRMREALTEIAENPRHGELMMDVIKRKMHRARAALNTPETAPPE